MSEVVECYCGAMVSAFRDTDEDGAEILDARCPHCGRWCGRGLFDPDEGADERRVVGWSVTCIDPEHRFRPSVRVFQTRAQAQAYACEARADGDTAVVEEVRR